MAELYGYVDADTGDWIDGLFANLFREMNRPTEQKVNIEYPRIYISYFPLTHLNSHEFMADTQCRMRPNENFNSDQILHESRWHCQVVGQIISRTAPLPSDQNSCIMYAKHD